LNFTSYLSYSYNTARSQWIRCREDTVDAGDCVGVPKLGITNPTWWIVAILKIPKQMHLSETYFSTNLQQIWSGDCPL